MAGFINGEESNKFENGLGNYPILILNTIRGEVIDVSVGGVWQQY